jgi:hypothetical protein
MASLTPRSGVDIYITFSDLQVELDRIPVRTMVGIQKDEIDKRSFLKLSFVNKGL